MARWPYWVVTNTDDVSAPVGRILLSRHCRNCGRYSVLVYLFVVVFFFFSSRRRHTRWTGDWSSDVCSSDLITRSHKSPASFRPSYKTSFGHFNFTRSSPSNSAAASRTASPASSGTWCGERRSEERRVGKECRSRWSPDHEKKKKKNIEQGSR